MNNKKNNLASPSDGKSPALDLAMKLNPKCFTQKLML